MITNVTNVMTYSKGTLGYIISPDLDDMTIYVGAKYAGEYSQNYTIGMHVCRCYSSTCTS